MSYMTEPVLQQSRSLKGEGYIFEAFQAVLIRQGRTVEDHGDQHDMRRLCQDG